MAGALTGFNQTITDLMTAKNPLYDGPWSDALSLLPFLGLIAGLYLAGRAGRGPEVSGPAGLVQR
jgi:hypothetical protein